MKKNYTKTCQSCNKEFSKRKWCSLLDWGKVKFCSHKCYSHFRSVYYVGNKHPGWIDGRSNEIKKCLVCEKEFNGARDRVVCGYKCSIKKLSKYNTGKGNWRWKGGRIAAKGGYIKVRVYDHPNADRFGYILEHRLKMEKKIGRYLLKNEIVHHKNHKRDDNRLSNLELMNKIDHDRMHTIERHKKEKLFNKLNT